MKKIGLTGGIGVGKTAVARLFRELAGAAIVDADQVARELRSPGGAAEAPLLARFGTLDRTELRKRLSSDPKAKADLEGILHPLIRKKSDEILEALEKTTPRPPFAIYEASLLIESGRASDFDALIVVTAPLPERLTRIMARDHIEKEAALAMIDAQSTDEFRLNHATYHVQNLGNLEDLRSQVAKIVDQIQSA
jgi:dephospho-CoA kinase